MTFSIKIEWKYNKANNNYLQMIKNYPPTLEKLKF